MDEYINIIWRLFEITANAAECGIITFFVTKMLGYKVLKHDSLCGILLFSASYLNSMILPKINTSSAFSATSQIIVCIIFSLIFLRGNILYKIFISMASVFMILIINSAVLALFSLFFKTPIYMLISQFGSIRLAILITTKLLYLTAAIILVNHRSFWMGISSKNEYITLFFTLIYLLIFSNFLFESITNQNSSIKDSLGIISLMITSVYLYTHTYIKIKRSLYHKNNTERDILRVIQNEEKKFSKRGLPLNISCIIDCDLSESLQENICTITYDILNEVFNSFDDCKYEPHIDFELYIYKGKASLIISHYLRTSLIPNRIDSDKSVPFDPYCSKKIKSLFKPDVYLVYVSRKNPAKCITNIWLADFL